MPTLPPLADFENVTPLAVGGMAELYRARARVGPLAGREVVLKRLLPRYRTQRAYVELFLNEARLGVMLVHPNIVHTHDLFVEDEDYFLVQDFAPGPTLAQLQTSAASQGRRVGKSTALVVVSDVLAALSHLHEATGAGAIIHRDVNPDNVMVLPSGVAKLIDFGIAEQQGRALVARSGALRGTPAYMSPEQVKGRALDVTSDLFSAGIVLWELLAGRSLFLRESEFETMRQVVEEPVPALRHFNPEVHPAYEALCEKALATEPGERFLSAFDMRGALVDACDVDGVRLDREQVAREVRQAGETD